MILVIDYGMGNLRSVEKALAHIGADAQVSSDPGLISKAGRIILHGVGSFDHAARIVIERWRREYNEVRPHSSLGNGSPGPAARCPRPLMLAQSMMVQ